jgi:hypothetical protein
MTLGFGAINFVGQLMILALVYISNTRHPQSTSTIEVKFVDGQYDTGGRQFTRETFSCMMGNLYLAREPWSTNACSEYVSRFCVTLGFWLENCALTFALSALCPVLYGPTRRHWVSSSRNLVLACSQDPFRRSEAPRSVQGLMSTGYSISQSLVELESVG